jgi:ubiquinone/menaquinone biosynthesis C-methylase UbiE
LQRCPRLDRMSDMDSEDYVHGYSSFESQRLTDQAETLSQLLHHDSIFRPPGLVLEAGCGTGAQTVTLSKMNPECSFISIDISSESLAIAQQVINKNHIGNVYFQQADLLQLPFPDEYFDHIFVCFVLEHLPDPAITLDSLKKALKKGGTITIIEGDHGSAFFYPSSKYAQKAIDCLIEIQAAPGADSLIGRRLYPLITSVGFQNVYVSPRFVYADGGHPLMQDGFTRKTFTAMVQGVREQVLKTKMMSETDWDRGITDLYRTAEPDGTFCYTFFKATAKKQ